MVWSVKYRRKILKPEIEEYLQELVQQIAADKGFTVHLFECGECDHVNCFVFVHRIWAIPELLSI